MLQVPLIKDYRNELNTFLERAFRKRIVKHI